VPDKHCLRRQGLAGRVARPEDGLTNLFRAIRIRTETDPRYNRGAFFFSGRRGFARPGGDARKSVRIPKKPPSGIHIVRIRGFSFRRGSASPAVSFPSPLSDV